jgi:hypothetical protein
MKWTFSQTACNIGCIKYYVLYELRLSRRLNAIKSSRATSRVKIELQSNVSEALSASIIRVVLCMLLIYSIYPVRPLANRIEEQSSLRSFVQSRCAWRIQF